ncbi:MAG: CopG family transcriptional regulator [Pyrinomonadaceae bacterium]|jgi:antitoxin component of RelBE/YafQ-DinJ toxin-antitoxin module|nr:CopG family transcriptional regulator [Pyrinomonadaceae bacterium]MDQ3172494.1 CopG family transcriptional regulator [Acidobacteriota bacterium]
METIQLTIDESLSAEMNRVTDALRMTPSDFMRVALERALAQREIIALERRDAQGYLKQPQHPEEIEEWQSEQEWGEP